MSRDDTTAPMVRSGDFPGLSPEELAEAGKDLYPKATYRSAKTWRVWFAEGLGVAPRTLKGWLSGHAAVPEPVARLIRAAWPLAGRLALSERERGMGIADRLAELAQATSRPPTFFPRKPDASKGDAMTNVSNKPNEEAVAEARRLRRLGLSYAKIGEDLGIGRSAAQRCCQDVVPESPPNPGSPKLGEDKVAEIRRLRRGGRTCKEIGVLLCISHMTAFKYARDIVPDPKKAKKLPEDLAAQIQALRAAGQTYDDISTRFGISKRTASRYGRQVKDGGGATA